MTYFDTIHTATLADIEARFEGLHAPELEGRDEIMLSELRALSTAVTEVAQSRRPQIDRDPQSFTYGSLLGADCAIRDRAEDLYWDIQLAIEYLPGGLFHDLSTNA